MPRNFETSNIYETGYGVLFRTSGHGPSVIICCAAIVDDSIAAAASSTWGRDATGTMRSNPFCSALGMPRAEPSATIDTGSHVSADRHAPYACGGTRPERSQTLLGGVKWRFGCSSKGVSSERAMTLTIETATKVDSGCLREGRRQVLNTCTVSAGAKKKSSTNDSTCSVAVSRALDCESQKV